MLHCLLPGGKALDSLTLLCIIVVSLILFGAAWIVAVCCTAFFQVGRHFCLSNNTNKGYLS